ncbi:MAG: hypothetical protein K1Y36_15350 [Blastocatellia bacterium]|nr:hypothetical protein [Blastocatellia bacterium]
MTRFYNALDSISIASPCTADWDQMIGNDKVRFCNQCQLNVYNFSGMSQTEALKLVQNREGRLCVRFYRRADGSVLTQNCPVGLAAFKRRVSKIASACAGLLIGLVSGMGTYLGFVSEPKPTPIEKPLMGALPVVKPAEQPVVEQGKMIMGDIAVPPAPPIDELKETPTQPKSRPLPVMGRLAVRSCEAPPAKK